jgi:Ser/Thr protein kinase RdoA (MazF antagonist)
MNRQMMLDIFTKHGLDSAASMYGIPSTTLTLYPDYLGCQNLVYDYTLHNQPMILRVSYRKDRPLTQVQAEVDFINYLADHGVRVSKAVPSVNGNLVEPLQVEGLQYNLVSFVKARGMRVPDNHYRYREGGTIDEYCQNWGQILGQMHRLTRQYAPHSPARTRPDWLALYSWERIDQCIPTKWSHVRQKFVALLSGLADLPKATDAYGLIHADVNDGNFCVDYDNGDITLFDFDDASYGWFVYELASAWEGFTGRAAFLPEPQKRRTYMDRCFDQILVGYHREYNLDSFWISQLPLFLKVIEMESLVCRMEDRQSTPSTIPPEDQGEVDYLIRCITHDIPYLGIYDTVFSPEHPFSLR